MSEDQDEDEQRFRDELERDRREKEDMAEPTEEKTPDPVPEDYFDRPENQKTGPALMDCDWCNGRGEVIDPIAADGSLDEGGVKIECSNCEGSGRVPLPAEPVQIDPESCNRELCDSLPLLRCRDCLPAREDAAKTQPEAVKDLYQKNDIISAAVDTYAKAATEPGYAIVPKAPGVVIHGIHIDLKTGHRGFSETIGLTVSGSWRYTPGEMEDNEALDGLATLAMVEIKRKIALFLEAKE